MAFTLLATDDRELQALHLILAVLEHWLPVKKLDGELPELAAHHSVARARVARYLVERFQQEHPF